MFDISCVYRVWGGGGEVEGRWRRGGGEVIYTAWTSEQFFDKQLTQWDRNIKHTTPQLHSWITGFVKGFLSKFIIISRTLISIMS